MSTITSLALAALGLAIPGAAIAGANKTWVSGTGKDTGTCPITAPCASFQYAVNQTAAGGEVDVKDAGGYGTLVITKSISVVAPVGVLATISVPAGGTGIAIQSKANDHVYIRGVVIDGHNVGSVGISVQSLAMLNDVTVRNSAVGIELGYYGNSKVSNNIIEGCSTGIHNGGFLILSGSQISQSNVGVKNEESSPVESTGDNLFTHNLDNILGGNVSAFSKL